jgi:hypothetical protein
MMFIFVILFVLPLIFTREGGKIAWQSVIKIWQDQVLLVPLFVINHWLLVPKLVLKKKYTSYLIVVFILISASVTGYYAYDEGSRKTPDRRPAQNRELQPARRRPQGEAQSSRPQPVPPYADLLLFSLMVVSVDTGLSFTKHWHLVEEDRVRLEKENIQAQLGMLRNQISPHFFMNTLNNIYSLIDADKERSRQAVMKLSKLMRYLLYENQNGKVLLSREFDFIRSYVDLIKLRYVDEVKITLKIPDIYSDVEIPVLLFISYLENAFKYGASYEHDSFINAAFELDDKFLTFTCENSRNWSSEMGKDEEGGIGLTNSRQRLDLLYGNRYSLDVRETSNMYTVKLIIPVA